jgi:hypothetical protein
MIMIFHGKFLTKYGGDNAVSFNLLMLATVKLKVPSDLDSSSSSSIATSPFSCTTAVVAAAG